VKEIKGYYFVTDASLSKKGMFSDVENAVAANVRIVQYRNKNGTSRELFDEAFELMKRCPNSIFIVNDRVDIALAVDADGVHLGQDDIPFIYARKLLGPKKIIGITVHNIEQAKEAERLRANYVAVSPIFTTKTKHDAGEPVGIDLIREVKQIVSVPVVAIGGINLTNAMSVIQAGASSLCAISDVIAKDDVKSEIKKYQQFFGL
jgi:thiamine-phosphate pyrophosphorylase